MAGAGKRRAGAKAQETRTNIQATQQSTAQQQPPAAYDGPGSASGEPSRGRTLSQPGHPPSRAASNASQTRGEAKNKKGSATMLKNVDLGGNAYNYDTELSSYISTFTISSFLTLSTSVTTMSSGKARDLSSDVPDIPVGRPTAPFITGLLDSNPYRDKMPTTLMQRPAFSNAGKAVVVGVNSHVVTKWPTRDVYQYDIAIGTGKEMRAVIKLVWESKPVQQSIGQGFIFDGNKIGWGPNDLGKEIKHHVDLDAEKGIPPRREKDGTMRNNKFWFVMKPADNKKVRLASLEAYLNGKAAFDKSVLEAINFFDHLLRETPSKNLINLRRSYFSRVTQSNERTLLGGGIEAMKGVYQSIRAAEGKKLVVNVDVSNSCFWHEQRFDTLAFQVSGRKSESEFLADIAHVRTGQSEPAMWHQLKRLVRNEFYIKHRGQVDAGKIHKVHKIRTDVNAKTYTFEVKNKDLPEGHPKKITTTSMYDYFLKRYNVVIEKWQLPLIETTKRGTLFPFNLAYMCGGQRYPFKLNELQTAAMIKFAVSRPPARQVAIQAGLQKLNWQGDRYLKNYGMSIDPKQLSTKGRLLDPPEVQFGKGGTAKPMFSGRWDLKGKVFFKPNVAPLKSWGVCVLTPTQDKRPPVTKEQVGAFLSNFIKIYQGHGGIVENKNPPVVGGIPDVSKALEATFRSAGDTAQFRPQMLMVILTNRSKEVYDRVKKNMECRYGIMSQCVQASNVLKNAPQYCSNVLMKFNCKLGGTTSVIKTKKPYFQVPTMIIGADVSHAAPGSFQASFAALTVSLDMTCSRYGAGVQTNGHRVELITKNNLQYALKPLLTYWMTNIGGGKLPQHVYYFRDGVSEGQYAQLLKNEVADLKNIMREEFAMGREELVPKFTVVVAEKRHHIRFFPPPGPAADKNGNPNPGVLVERDVTHPFENDVYLCSHAAIQGTARPTHYHMLMDEMNVPVDHFQTLLYEHCYQYQRATTPVSLFPAVYYAHLASARASAHINESEQAKWERKMQELKRPGQKSSEKASETEAPKLMAMVTQTNCHLGMWYI